MSELVVNLVFGSVRTITGVIALFISWWAFSKDKPKLKVSVTECSHHFTVSQSDPNIKTVTFWVYSLVKNVGYRGPTIEDIELTFENMGKICKMIRKSYTIEGVPEKSIQVSPNKSFDLSATFWDDWTGNEKNELHFVHLRYFIHTKQRRLLMSLLDRAPKARELLKHSKKTNKKEVGHFSNLLVL